MTHALIIGIDSSTHRRAAFAVPVIIEREVGIDRINVVLAR